MLTSTVLQPQQRNAVMPTIFFPFFDQPSNDRKVHEQLAIVFMGCLPMLVQPQAPEVHVDAETVVDTHMPGPAQ